MPASPNRPHSRTQPRARSQQAKLAAARHQRSQRIWLATASSVLVLAVVAVLITVKATASHPGPTPASQRLAHVASQITTVPAATLAAVGTSGVTPLQPVSGHPAPLTDQNKPEVLYIGGEFCPFCAAERWALAVALGRFGTFTGLSFIHSSPTDQYASTPTLTFYKSHYTSRWLAFDPVEWENETHGVLQPPTAEQQALFSRYDSAGSFPFLDIGNRWMLTSAQFVPSALHGLTWAQVAAAIRTPGSPVARDVDGAANTITTALCQLTGHQPAAACPAKAAAAAG